MSSKLKNHAWNPPALGLSCLTVRSLAMLSAAMLTLPLSAAETGSILEEVVVTAQKRSENLQDVPISVSVLSGDFMQQNNLHSLQDLSGAVPGLVVTNSVSYGLAPLTIRGLGGPNGGGSLFNAEPVGVYVDGVYTPALAQATSNLIDVGQLEVLRGPQGTLYGRNSTAGALLLTSNRPTTQFTAEARATYASFGEFDHSEVVSGPLIDDRLLGRFALAQTTGGDWATNQVDGKRVGGTGSLAGRGTLEYRPDNDLKIDLIADLSNSRSHPATVSLAQVNPVPTGPALGTLYVGNPFQQRSTLDLSSNQVEQGLPMYTNIEGRDVTALANWSLRGVTLDSITAYRDVTVSGQQDSSPYSQPYVLLGSNQTYQRTKSWSEEARLSNVDSESALKWTGGLFYYHQYNDDSIDLVELQGGPPVLTRRGLSGHASGTNLLFTGSQNLDSFALFADGTYDIDRAWSLTVGGRFSYEDKKADIAQLVTTITPTLIAGPVLAQSSCASSAISCSANYKDFSPRAVLNYKPADQLLLYSSYSRGFNSGGFNNFGNITNATDPTNPLQVSSETVNSYEIGAKSQFFDNKLRINVDAFLADYSNLQIRQAVITGGVAIVTVPSSQVKGLELDTQFKPIPELTLALSGSYLDAQLKKGELSAIPTNIGFVAPEQNIATQLQDIGGNAMTRSPKFQGNLSATYKLKFDFGSFDLNSSLRYQSSDYFLETDQNSSIYKSPAWREFDSRITFYSQNSNFDVTLFGRNLNDNRHVTQVAPYFGFPIAGLNAPRTVGITLVARY